ncbi:MAG: flagellar hook-basal body complex protein FliE [Candidatus Hydrogenedentota bacterium]|nr:MAG: flagellar hook-basal body complex protein FliE [Candidatus Hydrogenedentota bacterium]
MKISSFYHLLPRTMVKGDIIPLKVTEKSHWNDREPYQAPESASLNFAKALELALEKVNDQQVHAETLQQKWVADPKSVQPHTVMIAMKKAEMSLTFTKTVADLSVRSYKELVNLR